MNYVQKVRHVGLVVRDMERAITFYTRILGLEPPSIAYEQSPFLDTILGYKGVNVITAKMRAADGETLLELLKFFSPEECTERPGGTEYSFYMFGLTHVAFTVSRLSELLDDIEKAGGSRISNPTLSPDGMVSVAFCRDFEGNLLELVEHIKKV